jgi:hypothetical protein
MNTRRIITALVLPLALGCQLDAPKDPEHVALKRAYSYAFNEFTLTFIDVVDDSRCPEQVVCVSAGNAQIAVTAAGTTIAKPVIAVVTKQFLNTNVEPRSLKVSGATVTLDSLTPHRITTDYILHSSYTAYFTITRP